MLESRGGVLEYWSTGVLEYWSTGVLEYEPAEPVLQNSTTPVLQYSVHSTFGLWPGRVKTFGIPVFDRLETDYQS